MTESQASSQDGAGKNFRGQEADQDDDRELNGYDYPAAREYATSPACRSACSPTTTSSTTTRSR